MTNESRKPDHGANYGIVGDVKASVVAVGTGARATSNQSDISTGPNIVAKADPGNIKIVFMAANPTDTTRLRLDEEVRGIDDALRVARYGDAFQLEQHWAVRVTDLQRVLLHHQPAIVHFSGHGSAAGEIMLEDNEGRVHAVTRRALSTTFALLKDDIRCVVLNACFSQTQAQAIAEHIDCVIGMSTAIGDRAAINFAAAFYQALAYGRDIRTAFELGRNQIDLQNLAEQDTPQLVASKSDPSAIQFTVTPLHTCHAHEK